MDELEEDMGNRLRIPQDKPGGHEDYAKILRRLQWKGNKASTKEITKGRKANQQSMNAVLKWEKRYWGYDQLQSI
jgi:hypothetical protein